MYTLQQQKHCVPMGAESRLAVKDMNIRPERSLFAIAAPSEKEG
jgi:hypothetical protein